MFRYLKNKRKYRLFLKENRPDSSLGLLFAIETKLIELRDSNKNISGISLERLKEALKLCLEAQASRDPKTITNLFMILQVYFNEWQ